MPNVCASFIHSGMCAGKNSAPMVAAKNTNTTKS